MAELRPARGLRGEVDLKIPAASAVKIGGERAYKLHRRGVAVEMPTRRTTVHELELVGYEEPSYAWRCASARADTYGPSPRLSAVIASA